MRLLITMRHLFRRVSGIGLKLKTTRSVAVLILLVIVGMPPVRSSAAEEDGVALAIVYDTSGSMNEPVRDVAGKSSRKYIIANRALMAIANQIQTFATNSASGTPRTIHAGLFVFNSGGASEAVKFGPFDAGTIQNWAKTFSSPNGGTPLGNALDVASRVVLKSPLARKHVLVITDGMNNAGPDPAAVLPKLRHEAEQKQTGLSVHFVAFDVDAKVFEPVKKLGATVVGAADEKQLNTQLEFILQREILLEDDAPPKKK